MLVTAACFSRRDNIARAGNEFRAVIRGYSYMSLSETRIAK